MLGLIQGDKLFTLLNSCSSNGNCLSPNTHPEQSTAMVFSLEQLVFLGDILTEAVFARACPNNLYMMRSSLVRAINAFSAHKKVQLSTQNGNSIYGDTPF
jgi:hypothetical protein